MNKNAYQPIVRGRQKNREERKDNNEITCKRRVVDRDGCAHTLLKETK